MSEECGKNLLLPFLFNTEGLMLWPKRCWKVRFYSSPNSLPQHAALLTSPPPKWSHAQPVNHFSAPSFALRLIIILRTNKYVHENWDILFYTNTQSRIFYLLNNKLDENCLLIWWVYSPLDVLLYNRNNCFTQSCFYENSSVPSFKINYIASASARSYFQKMALIYSKQKKITKHNH